MFLSICLFIHSRIKKKIIGGGKKGFDLVYYETIKRELNSRRIYECRCDERLKPKGSTRLTYTQVVYYESIKREVKTRPIYECRCDERLKPKAEESTRLAYTGLLGELEHLKIETRLIDEKFASVMGECVRLLLLFFLSDLFFVFSQRSC
jgi:hypothetical protein